jgi:hypothetical protein
LYLADDLVGDAGTWILLALLLLVWWLLVTWRIVSTGDRRECDESACANAGKNRQHGAMFDRVVIPTATRVLLGPDCSMVTAHGDSLPVHGKLAASSLDSGV